MALQDAALSDEYFISRKLYPNVDFYSGLVYRALGFLPQYFTVLFAIPRIVGYCAHWREMQVRRRRRACCPAAELRAAAA